MRSSADQHIGCTTSYTILKVSILHKPHRIQWPTQHWANQSKDTVAHRETVNRHPIAGRYHALFKIHCISFQSTKRLGRHLWWNRNPLLFLRALNQTWQGTKYNVQRTVHKLWWFSASQLKKLNKDKDSQKILRSTTRNEINSRIENIPSRITASGLWPPHWTSGFFVLETFG